VSEDGVRLIHLRFPRLAWPRQLGTGITSAEPGSVESLVSAVHDIEASRAAPVAPGIDVSEVFHDASRPRSQRPSRNAPSLAVGARSSQAGTAAGARATAPVTGAKGVRTDVGPGTSVARPIAGGDTLSPEVAKVS
jgi:hypothetical protein